MGGDGGVAVQQMLNLLEPYDLRGAGFGSSRAIHLMTEIKPLVAAMGRTVS